MALQIGLEKRATRRFELRCPVTIKIRGQGKKREVTEGQLWEIGTGGAQISLPHALEEGTPLTVDVHFSHPNGSITTIRFEGVVARASREPRYEIVVQFRHSGRFLRDQMGDIFGIEYLEEDELGQPPSIE